MGPRRAAACLLLAGVAATACSGASRPSPTPTPAPRPRDIALVLLVQPDRRAPPDTPDKAILARWDPASGRVVASGQPFAELSWSRGVLRWYWDGNLLILASGGPGATARPVAGAAGDRVQVRTVLLPSIPSDPISFIDDRWWAYADESNLVVQDWAGGGKPRTVAVPRDWRTWGQVLLVEARGDGLLVLVQYFPPGGTCGMALARFGRDSAHWVSAGPGCGALQWPGATRIGDLAFVAGTHGVAQLNLSSKATSVYLSSAALDSLSSDAGLMGPDSGPGAGMGPVYVGAWNDTLLVAHHLLEGSGDWALWALQHDKVVGTLRMKIGSGQVQLSTGTSSASFALPPGYTFGMILLPQAGTP